MAGAGIKKVFEELKARSGSTGSTTNCAFFFKKLLRALKCKEVWVEGSLAFRNPREDMPDDWTDEQRRIEHYHALGKPLDAAFVDDLKTRLRSALTEFNERLPTLSSCPHLRPSKQEERGLWALTKLEAQPEPPGLEMVKERIGNRYGMLDLLDVFVEADRLVASPNSLRISVTKEGSVPRAIASAVDTRRFR